MTSVIQTQRTRGMRDLLPVRMARFRRVERVFTAVMAAWGYQEVRTPTLEHLHLFTSAGTLSPQLLDRVYSFLDWDGWSGERVVLRPDATIPAARVYNERMAGTIAKLCYVTNIFRFAAGDEPREVWQCGAEVIGDTWPGGDIEAIAAGRQVLQRLGLGDVTVRLSHTGVLRALLERAGFPPEEQADQYDRLLNGDLSLMRDLERRVPELQASMSLLTDVKGTDASYLANLRAAFASLSPALSRSLDELERVAAAVGAQGCPYEIDLTLVRDFEYYTGPVFRFRLADGAEAGGGGRYDALVRQEGGPATPACGFALEMDAIIDRLPPSQMQPIGSVIQVMAATDAADAVGLALSVALELQEKGFCAELAPSQRDAGTRWTLSVDPRGGGRRYVLRGGPGDTERAAATMDTLIGALGRASC
jgi:histidyl-tRNA synthetase